VIRQGQLQEAEPVAVPPPESDQKRDRARRAAQAGRLRVEAEEGSGGPGHSRQIGQPGAIDREIDRAQLAADVPAVLRFYGVAVESLGQTPRLSSGIDGPHIPPDRPRQAVVVGGRDHRGYGATEVGVAFAPPVGARGGKPIAAHGFEAAAQPGSVQVRQRRSVVRPTLPRPVRWP
jgi:hypothetical protein